MTFPFPDVFLLRLLALCFARMCECVCELTWDDVDASNRASFSLKRAHTIITSLWHFCLCLFLIWHHAAANVEVARPPNRNEQPNFSYNNKALKNHYFLGLLFLVILPAEIWQTTTTALLWWWLQNSKLKLFCNRIKSATIMMMAAIKMMPC